MINMRSAQTLSRMENDDRSPYDTTPDPLQRASPEVAARARREFEAAQKAKPRWVGNPKPKPKR